MIKIRTAAVAATIALVSVVAAGCNRSSGSSTSAGSSGGTGGGKVGIDLPRSDSDFWNSYAKYVNADVTSMGLQALTPTNSQNDITKLGANVQSLVAQGAKAIVMAPQDTAAV